MSVGGFENQESAKQNLDRKPTNQIVLTPGAHVHLMGICGTAMASLAGLLKDRGFRVTGSDQNVYPPMSTQLIKLGIQIMQGYKKENLKEKPDLVIVGNVISKSNEEAQELLKGDIPFTSLPSAMGQLVIEGRHSVVVSGTHGKTTTTSLVAWVLDTLDVPAGFMIGGIPKNYQMSFRNPQADWFVIEGDEYDTAFFDKVPKFIHYRPRSVILTSVEFDHADIYRDLDDVKSAFLRLIGMIPSNGLLVASAEDANIHDLLVQEADTLAVGGRRVVTFGIESGDYRAVDIQFADDSKRRLQQNVSDDGDDLKTIFTIRREGKKDQVIRTHLIGQYNIKNILACFALLECLGFDAQKIADGVLTFQGVKRRQEVIGCPNRVTIIEDFAHHPTAVGQTIATVQARYPQARVFSVFEPRSATSRRNVFQSEYAHAFAGAQSVVLAKPFNQAQIPEDQRLSIDKLVSALVDEGVDAHLFDSVDEIVTFLKKAAVPGDVILIMSNGGFDGIYEKLLKW